MNSNAKSLCENLQFEILSWLPPKSLLRYTSVCKSWHSTIHSSSFIKKHTTNLSQPNNCNRTVLVMPGKKPSTTCNFYSGKTCEIQSTLTLPFTPIGVVRVVGSCNGLICLVDKLSPCQLHLYIWNPSIRSLKLLPPCSFSPFLVKFSTFGIGFNELNNDYRVVRITNYVGNFLGTEVEVYSVSTDSWRMVNLGDQILPVRKTEYNSVSVNGYIYWLATERRILSFNMNSDSFEDDIIYPLGSGFYHKIYRIAVVRGQLCVLIEPYYGSTFTKDHEHEIWMMREHGVYESWTKLCRIQQGERLKSWTFGLTVKGELLHFTGVKNFCLYDHENLRYYDLCKDSIGLAVSYMESLISLDTQRDQKLNKKRKFSNM